LNEVFNVKITSVEFNGRDGHANTEKHAGKHALRTAFTEGEGQAGDDNSDE
jgi:hypothetical protein